MKFFCFVTFLAGITLNDIIRSMNNRTLNNICADFMVASSIFVLLYMFKLIKDLDKQEKEKNKLS